MILTINQLKEPLLNPRGLFKTLRNVYPDTDDSGNLHFIVHKGIVIFDVHVDDKPKLLCCALSNDSSLSEEFIKFKRLRNYAPQFFAQAELLDDEMTVFDSVGKSSRLSVLITERNSGIPFKTFVETHAGDKPTIMRVFHVIETAAKMLYAKGFRFSDNFYVTTTGIFIYSAESRTDRLAELSFAMYTALMSPKRLPCVMSRMISSKLLSQLCLAADCKGEPSYVVCRSLLELAESGDAVAAARIFAAVPECDIDAVASAETRAPIVEGVACREVEGRTAYFDDQGHRFTDFFLSGGTMREGRAEVETETGYGLIDKNGNFVLHPEFEELRWDDYYNVTVAMSFGRWNVYDRMGVKLTDTDYDWLGEYGEGLCLAVLQGKCGFIGLDGKISVPAVWDDASSFVNGRATVMRDGTSYTINTKGELINNDQYALQ